MKKTDFHKLLSLLFIAVFSFALSVSSVFYVSYATETEADFTEDFESYSIGGSVASGLTQNWYVYSVTGNDVTEIATDPTDDGNKVLRVRSINTDDYYYFLSPENLKLKNFEITFKVWFVDTNIKNGWVSVACRKETNDKYDSTKCALLTLNDNANKRDAMEYQPLTFNGEIKNVMTNSENGINYGIDKTFSYETWYNVRIIVQDNAYTAYFDGKDLGTGYSDDLTDGGYISLNVGQNEVFIDDVVIKNQERYSIAVSVDDGCPDGGTVKSDRLTSTDREVTVTATANRGYAFNGWYNGNDLVSEYSEYTFMPTENVNLTAKFIPETYNLTVITDGNGVAEGDGIYETGEELTLTALPQEGNVFVGWFTEYGKLSSELSFNYKMDPEDTEITALFLPEDAATFTVEAVNVQATRIKDGEELIISYTEGDEMGYAEGNGVYYAGEPVSLKAHTNFGYEFAGWYREDVFLSDGETYRFLCEEDTVIKAVFRVKTYKLTVVNGKSGETNDYLMEAGNVVTVYPKAAPTGYYFTGWVLGVSYEQDKDGAIKFIMPEKDITAKAVYAEKTYSVSIKSDGVNGVIGGGNKKVGERVICSVFVENGYTLLGYNVVGAEGVLTEDGSLVFEMPSNDVSVEAVLAKNGSFPYAATVIITVIAVLIVTAIVLYTVKSAKGDKENG